jgi:aspartyl aminopeptidase
MADEDKLDRARDLLDFIDRSPSPYHAVAEARRRLEAAGFTALDERETWSLRPGEQAFLIRGGGALIAVRAGSRPPSESGFLIVGAHTDSPGLRIRPCPDVHASGYLQLAVELYGSPLLFTWLDRDLGVAGRVTLRGGSTRLVDVDRPVARIPSLALHLQRGVNQEGLKLDAQEHLLPVLRMESAGESRSFVAELGTSTEDVLGWDLCLYDVQPACLGGAANDFLFASRLDDLVGCHAAISALVEAAPREITQLVVLYDFEETGSQAASGAHSRWLLGVLERLVGGSDLSRALARSLLVSTDMAHALHPSHANKHDPAHAPILGGGPVVKHNANQSYATDGPAAAVFAEACRAAGFAPQRFVARNDLPAGSTIGPIAAALTSIRTVDVGNPMLSMHACREMAGARDVDPMIRALVELLSRGQPPDPDC